MELIYVYFNENSDEYLFSLKMMKLMMKKFGDIDKGNEEFNG